MQFSEQDILDLCANPSSDHIISGESYGHRILKISEVEVVKYGWGLAKSEADNQRLAHSLLDSSIVRVPRVHHFFTCNEIGYLVMEFVAGEVVTSLTNSHYKKIAEILLHMQSFCGEIPQNFCGHGVVHGYPFTDIGVSWGSITRMEAWLNKRLLRNQGSISFGENCRLVLCHRDLAPRNLLWTKEGAVYLLDWATAGYFPVILEYCTQALGKDITFNERVQEILRSMSTIDDAQFKALLRISANCQMYYYAEES